MKNGKERSKTAETLVGVDESEFETQGFEPHEDDSDQLWDVETILNEKNGGRYLLVRWIGADENGKPWEDSWVPREDVTDDLVQEWKKKKAAKKAERGRKRREQRRAKSKVCTLNITLANVNYLLFSLSYFNELMFHALTDTTVPTYR